jgi:hypothetical protein
MNNLLIALQKIIRVIELSSNSVAALDSINKLATEAINSFKKERMYSLEEFEAVAFNSFIVGIANPQLEATELISFHKEWFDKYIQPSPLKETDGIFRNKQYEEYMKSDSEYNFPNNKEATNMVNVQFEKFSLLPESSNPIATDTVVSEEEIRKLYCYGAHGELKVKPTDTCSCTQGKGLDYDIIGWQPTEQPISSVVSGLVDIEEPIGTFILANADGTQTPNGMYYHYVQVCHLLNTQKKAAPNHLDELQRWFDNDIRVGATYHRLISAKIKSLKQ